MSKKYSKFDASFKLEAVKMINDQDECGSGLPRSGSGRDGGSALVQQYEAEQLGGAGIGSR
ncbi:hypothetical protein HAQ04_13650 [Pseudomonas sp. C2L11]|nr:hypothetical protein [Pseudomonas typographi]